MSLLSGRASLHCLALATALTAIVTAAPATAATAAPDLATAGSFAVLAASTVTNTGPSTIFGDLGVSPGTAITGFGPGTVSAGTIHTADAVALQAQRDLTNAYNTAAGLPPSANVTADLAGQRLVPGVYAGPTLSLTGALSLDAGGDADAVFVFQSASTLITASASSVLLLGGASPCNVFWQVGSSATLGTNSAFVGSVMALTSVTANTGASVQGRLLARNGAVTLDTNSVSRPLCAAAATPAATPSTATTAPSPSAPSSPEPVIALPRVDAAPTAGPDAPAPGAATSTVVITPEETAAPAAPVIAEPTPASPSPTMTPTPTSPASSAPALTLSNPTGANAAVANQVISNPAADSSTSLTVPETVTNPQAAPPADLTQQVTGGLPPTTITELPRTGAPLSGLAGGAVLLMTFGLLCLMMARPTRTRASSQQAISPRSAA